MHVLHVCSELYPLLKTGGLADVAGALPSALERLGCSGRVLVPGFPAFMQGIIDKKLLLKLPPKFGASALSIYLAKIPGTNIPIYLIDAPGLYDRPGNPYADEKNSAYPDNYRRFALLGWLAAQLAEGLDPDWRPQVVHSHDWHAGLTAAYLKAAEISRGSKLAGSILTVHNLAYQGVFPGAVFNELELPAQFYTMEGLEYYHQVSFLKAGLYYSDRITTVSPSYAREIQSDEQGCGLNGLLSQRRHDLSGILNGVDPEVWSPAIDPFLEFNYSSVKISAKLKCKSALQQATGLTLQNETPLFAVVSRLTEQKGLNLVLSGIAELLNRGGQIVVLGGGDARIEEEFKAVAAEFPHSVAVQLGYDEIQAHRIIAGSDVILVPSRFEPCGLTQLYGLMYGTLPLVRRVGGLADTVTDCTLENLADKTATGFVFENFSGTAYSAALRRAFALFAKSSEWKRVQKRAMQQNFSWEAAALQYMALYQQLAV